MFIVSSQHHSGLLPSGLLLWCHHGGNLEAGCSEILILIAALENDDSKDPENNDNNKVKVQVAVCVILTTP